MSGSPQAPVLRINPNDIRPGLSRKLFEAGLHCVLPG